MCWEIRFPVLTNPSIIMIPSISRRDFCFRHFILCAIGKPPFCNDQAGFEKGSFQFSLPVNNNSNTFMPNQKTMYAQIHDGFREVGTDGRR